MREAPTDNRHADSPLGKNLVYYARQRGWGHPDTLTPDQIDQLKADRKAWFDKLSASAEKSRRLKKARRLKAEAAEIEALYGDEAS